MAGLLPSGGYGTGSEVMRRIAVLIAGGMVSRRQGKWMICGKANWRVKRATATGVSYEAS
jgi:hypothetical protein